MLAIEIVPQAGSFGESFERGGVVGGKNHCNLSREGKLNPENVALRVEMIDG